MISAYTYGVHFETCVCGEQSFGPKLATDILFIANIVKDVKMLIQMDVVPKDYWNSILPTYIVDI